MTCNKLVFKNILGRIEFSFIHSKGHHHGFGTIVRNNLKKKGNSWVNLTKKYSFVWPQERVRVSFLSCTKERNKSIISLITSTTFVDSCGYSWSSSNHKTYWCCDCTFFLLYSSSSVYSSCLGKISSSNFGESL